ncbi:unnamed protein product (macronuclear) [Paramecium tetraurelia]|uniref:Uncharacterized protein n=1 Tax=Paramecium tetraurelia TaxID=5888 RepID=A0D4U8_PARTE|nr:uncharacterized protein GSPATT00013512001 [Paramecium tetraurelia]CAK78065.1 unnamed protein product [Paramecium tetraurelia]|eukprot:XP_001445462.1 hypothetical protein (macronuclear) [Paramecium tetraurelia strain d4-2]
MNKTIDCFGRAENLIIHERPLTISYIDENSPQKLCNLSLLLASQKAQKNQKHPRRSFYQATLKDYQHQANVPTRSPPILQIQLQNYQFTQKTTKSTKNQSSKQQGTKYKSLSLNECNYSDILKRIELKKSQLEKMYPSKEKCKTQTFRTEKIEDGCQTQKLPTEANVQSNKTKKHQEFLNYRLAQSRIGSSFKNKRTTIPFQAMPLSLGLNIEKCRIEQRLTQSPFSVRASQIKSIKTCSVRSKDQRSMTQKPIDQQFCFKKQSSIPIAKWDNSDLELD